MISCTTCGDTGIKAVSEPCSGCHRADFVLIKGKGIITCPDCGGKKFTRRHGNCPDCGKELLGKKKVAA